MNPRARALVVLVSLAAACGSPAATKSSYAGQWSGATAQGAIIAFTVSPDAATPLASRGPRTRSEKS
jgi:hypothetical protein